MSAAWSILAVAYAPILRAVEFTEINDCGVHVAKISLAHLAGCSGSMFASHEDLSAQTGALLVGFVLRHCRLGLRG